VLCASWTQRPLIFIGADARPRGCRLEVAKDPAASSAPVPTWHRRADCRSRRPVSARDDSCGIFAGRFVAFRPRHRGRCGCGRGHHGDRFRASSTCATSTDAGGPGRPRCCLATLVASSPRSGVATHRRPCVTRPYPWTPPRSRGWRGAGRRLDGRGAVEAGGPGSSRSWPRSWSRTSNRTRRRGLARYFQIRSGSDSH